MIKLMENFFLTCLILTLHIKATPYLRHSVSSRKTQLTSGAFELSCQYASQLHVSAEVIMNTERNASHFIKVIQMIPE